MFSAGVWEDVLVHLVGDSSTDVLEQQRNFCRRKSCAFCRLQRQEDGRTMMCDLPDEVLRCIFVQLADHQDLVNAGLAGSRTFALSEENSFWRRLCAFHFTNRQWNSVLRSTEDLDIVGWKQLYARLLRCVQCRVPFLMRRAATFCWKIWIRGISQETKKTVREKANVMIYCWTCSPFTQITYSLNLYDILTRSMLTRLDSPGKMWRMGINGLPKVLETSVSVCTVTQVKTFLFWQSFCY